MVIYKGDKHFFVESVETLEGLIHHYVLMKKVLKVCMVVMEMRYDDV